MNRVRISLFSLLASLQVLGALAQNESSEDSEFSVHKYFMDLNRDFEQEQPSAPAGPGYTIQPRDLVQRAPGLRKEIFGYLPYWFRDRWTLIDYNLVSTIAYFSGEAGANGAIGSTHGWPRYPGDPSANASVISMINAAHAKGVKVVLCITNFSGAEIDTIVSTPSYRTTLIQQSLALVQAGNGDGININFEGILHSTRPNLTLFMRELADTFHTRMPGSQVSCAPTDFDLRYNGGDWDLVGVEPFVDLFFVQGYGYGYGGSSVSMPVGLLPNTSFWGSTNVTTLIDNVVLARIETTKVVLGLPHFGYRWPTVSGNPKASTQGSGVAFYYPDAILEIADHGRLWDVLALNPWFRYQTGSQWYQGWYDDAESMSHKYQFALSRRLMGVGMWALGMDADNHDIWDALAAFFSDTVIVAPPHPPTLIAARDSSSGAEGRIVVQWAADAQFHLGGFRLYMNQDPFASGFPPILDEASLDAGKRSAVITGLQRDSTYYVKLVAVDTSGTQVSDTTDTYGVRTGTGERYLVVDGFDRISGSYTQPKHPFNVYYGGPLSANGRRFDSGENSAVAQGVMHLRDYIGVIWFLGDESTVNHTFTSAEQETLKSYLRSGGRLFVSGSEVGYDLDRPGSPNYSPDFYENYLKSVYVGDKASGLTFYGATSGIFSGLSGSFGQTYPEDYPDYLSPVAGADTALLYNGNQVAAVQYAGVFGTGTVPGKLVNLGFPFETIASLSVRTSLMQRIVDFFEAPASVPEERLLPGSFVLEQNYPNPFNPTTTIEFRIPNSELVMLNVYDVLGREVAVLVDERKAPGVHTVRFDASGLASGVYICRLTTAQHRQCQKMALVK